jgi:uncharacterized protein YndB with AHSA1/START domain
MTTGTTTTTETGIRIERTFAAPIQRVYDAWTRPELLTQWYCPNPALELTVETDLRVGGEWVATMGPHVIRGRYTELDEPALVAFTWSWDAFEQPPSRVRVELTEVEGGTLMVLRHTDLQDAEDVTNHLDGWDGCFARLPEVLLG